MKEQKGTDSGNRAVNMAALRAAVSLYLIYLGVSLLLPAVRGESTLPPALAWLAGAAFLIGGAAFLAYSWRQYRKARSTGESEGEQSGT